MGIFGGKKKGSGEATALSATAPTEPGAIPVATPIPIEETTYRTPSALSMPATANQIPIKATLVQSTTTTAAPQHYHQQHHQLQQQAFQDESIIIVNDDPNLGRRPAIVTQCPHCQQQSQRTKVTTYPGWQTWTASVGLCFVFWPICWIPLVLDNCKQTDHYCTNCGSTIGRVSPFSDCCVTHRG